MLQAESEWIVCFARFIQNSIYPPLPNPQGMHLTCTISGGWVYCADLKLSSQGQKSGGLIWSCSLVWTWRSDLTVVWFSGLVFGFVGLIWTPIGWSVVGWILYALFSGSTPVKDGLVWQLKIENIKIWGYSSEIALMSPQESCVKRTGGKIQT